MEAEGGGGEEERDMLHTATGRNKETERQREEMTTTITDHEGDTNHTRPVECGVISCWLVYVSAVARTASCTVVAVSVVVGRAARRSDDGQH